MKQLVLTLCLCIGTPAALATTASGAELLMRCSAYEKSLEQHALSAEEALDAMWCMGYVSGLMDGFGVSDFRIGETIAVCPEEAAISRNQALAIILRWLRDNPQEHSKSGRRGAIIALTHAFPCNK